MEGRDLRTALTDRLSVEHPVVGFNRSPAVVAEVSKAGGFGVLAGSAFTPEELDAQLSWIEEQVEGKPYGVGIWTGSVWLSSEVDFANQAIKNKFLAASIGQVVGSCREVRPAADILRQIVDDCQQRITDLNALL